VLKKIDCVISSSFARAFDTARNLVGVSPWNILSNTTSELLPDSTPEKAWREISYLADTVDAKHILIVTHDPLIQPLLAGSVLPILTRAQHLRSRQHRALRFGRNLPLVHDTEIG